jgi:hypothetical protein
MPGRNLAWTVLALLLGRAVVGFWLAEPPPSAKPVSSWIDRYREPAAGEDCRIGPAIFTLQVTANRQLRFALSIFLQPESEWAGDLGPGASICVSRDFVSPYASSQLHLSEISAI